MAISGHSAKELLAVGDGYGRGSQSSSKGGHCQVNRLIFMSSTDWTQWVIKKKSRKNKKEGLEREGDILSL